MDNFTNSVLIPENLPEIKSETFHLLDKKYLNIIFIRILIFALILFGGFAAFLFIPEEMPPVLVIAILLSVIVILLAYSSLITILGFPRKGYLVRDKDVSYKKGLITYKQTSVPFNRIQHVEVNQGVLEKLYRLSSVKIYTAGGTSSDLSIPGLPAGDAQKLKAFLSEKISEHE